jgi:hypothetical protein
LKQLSSNLACRSRLGRSTHCLSQNLDLDATKNQNALTLLGVPWWIRGVNNIKQYL